VSDHSEHAGELVDNAVGPDVGLSADDPGSAAPTPDQGPGPTPDQGPGPTPDQGPGPTPDQGPGPTPDQGRPGRTPGGATPDQGLGRTPDQGLGATPDQGLGATPDQGLGATPDQGLGATPDQGLGATPDQGLGLGDEERPDRPVVGGVRRAAGVVATVVLVVAALGAPLGWLWSVVAPDVPVQRTLDGVVVASAEPEQFMAADGWFVVLGAGYGVLVAIAVWFLVRRYRGPVGLLAATLGAIGAGVLAWWVGHKIGLSQYERLKQTVAVGTSFGKPPDLRIKELGWWLGFIPKVQGDLLVPAIAVAIPYTMLAAWSRYPSLRRETEPAAPATEAAETEEVGHDDQAGGTGQFTLGGTANSDNGTGTART
jgi:hypothetical protein